MNKRIDPKDLKQATPIQYELEPVTAEDFDEVMKYLKEFIKESKSMFFWGNLTKFTSSIGGAIILFAMTIVFFSNNVTHGKIDVIRNFFTLFYIIFLLCITYFLSSKWINNFFHLSRKPQFIAFTNLIQTATAYREYANAKLARRVEFDITLAEAEDVYAKYRKILKIKD